MPELQLLGAARCDDQGILSQGQAPQSWAELGLDPSRHRLGAQALLGHADPAFRRLDALSRLCVAMAQRCLNRAALDGSTRRDTALVFGSRLGCLDSDRRFAASRRDSQGIAAALFPYTLPSTCLGEVSLRFGLQGPSLCLMQVEAPGTEALWTARQLLTDGEAQAVLLLWGDWCPGEETRLAALCLRPGPTHTPGQATLPASCTDPSSFIHDLLPGPWTA